MVVLLLFLDAALIGILATPEIASIWGILLLPVLIQLFFICIPIYFFWFSVMTFKIPIHVQPFSNFSSFLEWKAASIEKEEEPEKQEENDLLVPFLELSDTSSTSEMTVSTRKKWPVWTFGRYIFEGGPWASPMRSLFLANKYTPIFFWAERIVLVKTEEGDPNKRRRLDATRPRDWVLRIVSLLNLGICIFDLQQAFIYRSLPFMVSAFVRLIILPLVSVFHLGTAFAFGKKCKDRLIKLVNLVCGLFAIAVFIMLIVLFVYFRYFNTIMQLRALDPPTNFSVPFVPRPFENDVCGLHYNSISVWDMIGYALGPHEFYRNEQFYIAQMQYFFGENWTSRFTSECQEFNSMPVMVYHDIPSNVTVIGLRASASGPELAFHMELFVWAYILPMVTDIAPFYETLTDWRVPFLTSASQNFGNSFFDVDPVPHQMVDPVLDYLDELGINDESQDFLLVGIGTGGILAKTIGMLRARKAFAFWSMQAFEGSYAANFDFDEMDSTYITNVYNFAGGLIDFRIASEEPGVGNNFGIPWIEGSLIARDTRYRSLCTMYAMCAQQGMLYEYCNQSVDDMDVVIEAFAEEPSE
jgi:hypothetical protein